VDVFFTKFDLEVVSDEINCDKPWGNRFNGFDFTSAQNFLTSHRKAICRYNSIVLPCRQ